MSPKRSGIIPYYTSNGEIIFIFGEDSTHQTLTDFGGYMKKHETYEKCALREFNEESLLCFSGLAEEDLNQTFFIQDSNSIIFFLQIEFDKDETDKCFKHNLLETLNPEVTKLVYLNKEELKKSIDYSFEIKKDLYEFKEDIQIIYSKILNIIQVAWSHFFD